MMIAKLAVFNIWYPIFLEKRVTITLFLTPVVIRRDIPPCHHRSPGLEREQHLRFAIERINQAFSVFKTIQRDGHNRHIRKYLPRRARLIRVEAV